MKNKISAIILPFLATLFPILFLISANRSELTLASALPAILLVLGVVVFLLGFFQLVFKSLQKSSLLTTFVVLAFLSFGHLSLLMPAVQPIILFGFLSVIALLIFFVIIKLKKSINSVIQYSSLVVAVLVAFQLVSILFQSKQEKDIYNDKVFQPLDISQANDNRPDIYFLVLDGYGRGDVIQDIFGYDNSEFAGILKSKGFYLADSAHSNYCQTLFSLAATTNMTYVDSLGQPDIESIDRVWLGEKLQNNRLFDFFRRLNYELIAFSSGHQYTEFDGVVDHYINPADGLTEFNRLLLNTTPMPLFSSDSTSEFGYHRRRVKQSFDILSQLDKYSSPKFVFAHIVSPHPPFVLDENGNPTQPAGKFRFQDGSHYYIDGGTHDEYVKGYVNQMKYVNKRVLEVVDDILSQNENTIIVIQGDHGSRMELDWDSSPEANLRESFSILNAVYLPGSEYDKFYNSQSSVNTFRIILDQVFGLKLPLLEDRSYYNSWNQPYLYYDITYNDSTFATLRDYFEYGQTISKKSNSGVKVIGYYQATRRKKAGEPSNSAGCHIFDANGLKINLDEVNHSNRIELLLDANDNFTVYFNNGSTMLDSILIKEMFDESFLFQNRAVIPDKAANKGFDNIVIKPIGGDGFYSLGHLLLGNSR